MFKAPLDYKKEDLDKLMFKILKIEIGPPFIDQIDESLEGEIIDYSMAYSSKPLIGMVDFQLRNGQIRKFPFTEIKSISLIKY